MHAKQLCAVFKVIVRDVMRALLPSFTCQIATNTHSQRYFCTGRCQCECIKKINWTFLADSWTLNVQYQQGLLYKINLLKIECPKLNDWLVFGAITVIERQNGSILFEKKNEKKEQRKKRNHFRHCFPILSNNQSVCCQFGRAFTENTFWTYSQHTKIQFKRKANK